MITKNILVLSALILAACGGTVVAPAEREPTCTAATYEAGGDRAVCGDASNNPVVVECDAPATRDQLTRIAGVCRFRDGAFPSTYCCDPDAPVEALP